MHVVYEFQGGTQPTFHAAHQLSFRVERSQHFTQRINLREILSVRVVQPRHGELHILYYKVVRHEQRPVHLAVVGDTNVGSQLDELFPIQQQRVSKSDIQPHLHTDSMTSNHEGVHGLHFGSQTPRSPTHRAQVRLLALQPDTAQVETSGCTSKATRALRACSRPAVIASATTTRYTSTDALLVGVAIATAPQKLPATRVDESPPASRLKELGSSQTARKLSMLSHSKLYGRCHRIITL